MNKYINAPWFPSFSIHELPIFEAICERHMLREDSVRLTSRRQEDVPWPDRTGELSTSQWIPKERIQMDPVLRCLNPTLQTLHGMVKGKDLHWGTISGCKDWEMGLTRRVGSRLKTRKRRQTILVNVTMCFFYKITNLCKQYQPLPECHDFV